MRLLVALVSTAFLFTALHTGPCVAAGEKQDVTWPTRGWPTSTPEAQGMDSRVLAILTDLVRASKQDSLLIVRNGKVVLDAYYTPYRPGLRHDLRSVTKSFVGTLVGLLQQQGKLDSLDKPILEFFPDAAAANQDERRRAITVQNVLDMASGIQWVEKDYTPEETTMQMYKSPNPVAFVLEQPMADSPGTKFSYKGGDSYLLSALVSKLAGVNALEFAKTELFAPLGITNVRWAPIDKQGIVTGEAGMLLAPHDMAKLGYLYLHDGVWDGVRLIPSAFVARARKGNVTTSFGKYANQWWSVPGEDEVYFALGRHSQVIAVLPRQNVVAVLTGALPDGDRGYSIRALVQFIKTAIKSDAPIPRTDDAAAALDAALLKAVTDEPTDARFALALAQQLSGKTWRFNDNTLLVRTIRLDLTAAEPGFEFTVYSPRISGRDTLITEPIGLDGRWRSKQQPFAYVANKGTFPDDDTFQLHRRFLGQGQMYFWTLKLDGDKLKLKFRSTDGWTVELVGEPVN